MSSTSSSQEGNASSSQEGNASSSQEGNDRYAFSADINQLLSLIINTFYTKKDVFLRELISNASDALSKAQFEGLTNHDALRDDEDLRIEVIPDKAARTLTIFDSGIGMSEQDLIHNLGTIAKSGTKAFMEAARSGEDMSMIGQFGVGFYSAFLVADKVVVTSRKAGCEQYCWESSASGSFNVRKDHDQDQDNNIKRGTRIVLHMKEGMEEYLDEMKLRDLIGKHTGFIAFKIYLQVQRTETYEEQAEQQQAQAQQSEQPEQAQAKQPEQAKRAQAKQPEQAKRAQAEQPEQQQAQTQTEQPDQEAEGTVNDAPNSESESEDTETLVKKTRTVDKLEVLNTSKPLWMRTPGDVTPEEYADFYKSSASDWENHLAVSHFKVEGQLEFRGLLFIPPRPPFDMFSGGEERKFNNIKLYARRVFIQENAQTMMPEYLSFVHGLVDSDDLPLTISRENLQQTRILQVIRKNLVKKVIEAIEALAQDDDAEKYKKFYSHFSRNLKLGVHDDSKNRERLTNLLRFRSSKDEENESRSLADYVADMDSAQKDIYYLIGESPSMVASSPFVERIKARGYEVLYMTEAIDEYTMQQITDYDGKKLICATEEGLTLPGEDPGGERELIKTFKPACDKVKEILGDYVDKVVISQRMENSPCCLVSGKYGYSANMERILKAQALRDPTNSSMVPAKKIMELNPQHVLVRQLRDAAPKDDNAHKTICSDLSWVLYETALLTSGFSLDNPSAFADRVHRLVAHGLGLLETPPGVPLPLPPSLRDTMNNDSGANTDAAPNATPNATPNAATEDTSGEMEQVD